MICLCLGEKVALTKHVYSCLFNLLSGNKIQVWSAPLLVTGELFSHEFGSFASPACWQGWDSLMRLLEPGSHSIALLQEANLSYVTEGGWWPLQQGPDSA